ncbi:LacI family DNA-binding transcriptional regulator [Pseudonocardia humida]|uniref:LacI family DNA-binding transcriptional regulator n=1 Tax=Pseudonocardia humida TaxID=2800819 RepID=A0ABT1A156_9PSEU|nr:LacI family DNA-binding transcriptional regulator [Pseudonocardia humida]MCO1656732.1 LacI family DNA-binding transcriptional regulator [Pseudonocardia humida]
MARVTITEIARRAGVSKGAVSYALNGQPGVSASTRARVLRVAAELDWVPNSAARMLSGARTDTIGLVLARGATREPSVLEFVAGMETVLARHAQVLLLRMASGVDEEVAGYRKWASERRVDAVVVVEVLVDDPRVALLGSLDLPALVAGDPGLAGGLAAVGVDDGAGVTALVEHLVGRGHRTVGWVSGPAHLGRVHVRERAFAAAEGIAVRQHATDLTGGAVDAATRELLGGDDRPTAIVYDGGPAGVAGLSAIGRLGLRVPDDVAVVVWGDSAVCGVTEPALTAVGCDVAAYGAAVGEGVLGLVGGRLRGGMMGAVPTLRVRDSS